MTEPANDRQVRSDVGDVLVRYATGIDRRDWVAFRTCFADDCDADYGDIGVWHGADAITDFMRASHDGLGYTMHRITNQAVTPTADGATARSYVDAIILLPGNETGFRAVGFYDDELVNTGDGWKIARRRFTPVLMTTVDSTAPNV